MILPSKHLKPQRALLGVGAEILLLLDVEQTVSELWYKYQKNHKGTSKALTFDWFALALSFLFTLDAIVYDLDPLVIRKQYVD